MLKNFSAAELAGLAGSSASINRKSGKYILILILSFPESLMCIMFRKGCLQRQDKLHVCMLGGRRADSGEKYMSS